MHHGIISIYKDYYQEQIPATTPSDQEVTANIVDLLDDSQVTSPGMTQGSPEEIIVVSPTHMVIESPTTTPAEDDLQGNSLHSDLEDAMETEIT